MRIVIIDYGSGNLHSVQKALERAATRLDRAEIVVTSDADLVRTADRVILPGVGAFADCKQGLLSVDGLIPALGDVVVRAGRPFLGICVGMQLLATTGLEHETTMGLGWINGVVAPLQPCDARLRIPHMGWNTLTACQNHVLLRDIPLGDKGLHAYFVHSFHFVADAQEAIIATTEYGGEVCAVVAHDNIAGSQFHPEKSQQMGLAFLENFLRWRP